MEPFRLELQELPPWATSPRLPPRGMRPPVGGLDVPDYPVAPVGGWYSYDTWQNPNWGLLTPSAFKSAVRAYVLKSAPKGPRGGLYWQVESEQAWLAWATAYKARVTARLAGDARRRLGFGADGL
jgi:hypothetical protein